MSAETKHTPLPWAIVDRPGSLPEYDGLVIANRTLKEVVAEFHLGESYGGRAERHQRRRANVALIVRAVNAHDAMYEALEAAHQFIRNGIELGYIRMPDPDTPDSAHETPEKVRSALALARGEV